MKTSETMFDPPRPGGFIFQNYLETTGMSSRALAARLGVTPSTLQRVIVGQSGISPEMALRFSVVLGRTPESWLAMQASYDLWQAKKHTDLSTLEPLELGLEDQVL